jgi:hypothetical protein
MSNRLTVFPWLGCDKPYSENRLLGSLNLQIFSMLTCRRRSLLFLLVSFACCTSIADSATYSITVDEGTDAHVTKPEECDADISNGAGDLIEGGVRYRGKCEGAGIAPKIEEEDGIRYLKFATNPSYQGKTKTRSELALTNEWFPFGDAVYIGFRIKLPGEVDKTDAFFYMMQFWQCSPAAPIAGVRISRGHSHRVNFMTRGDASASSMAAYDLGPDTWASFVIKAIVDPTGEKGRFSVWNDPTEKPKVYRGSYGYARNGTCRGREEPPQGFRIKFGIYKGNETNKLYEVNYDEIRIGTTFDSVSPWAESG